MGSLRLPAIGLSQKFTISFLLLIALPLLFLGNSFYQSSRELVKNELSAANMSRVDNFNQYYLNEIFGNLDLFLNLWSTNPDIVKIFDDEVLLTHQLEQWEDALKGYPEVASIYIGTAEDDFVIFPVSEMSADFKPTQRPWYELAANNPNQTNWTLPYKDAVSGDFIFSVAHTIADAAGNVVGVIAIDVKLNQMSTLLTDANSNADYTLLVTDYKANIIAATDPSLNGKTFSAAYNTTFAFTAPEESRALDLSGIPTIISYTTNEQTNWRVVGLIPESAFEENLKPLRQLLGRVLIYTGIWAVVAIFLLQLMTHTVVVKPLQHLMALMSQVEKGYLNSSGNYPVKDEIGKLFSSFNSMLFSQREMIQGISQNANSLNATCDITTQVARQANSTSALQGKSMGEIATSIDDMSIAIADANLQIQQIASRMESANFSMQDMGNAAAEVAQNAVDTSESVHQVTSALRGLESEIQTIHISTESANEHGIQAIAILNAGQEVVDQTQSEMQQINKAMQGLKTVINQLSGSAQEISAIVDVIDDIADQTNLLSLNASIEAARAGEHGRGFAVVAAAIGRLAEKSSLATKDIFQIIRSIQSHIQSAVVATDSSVNSVDKGSQKVLETEVAFRRIAETMTQTSTLLASIAKSTQVQTAATKSIMLETEKVNELTMHVSAASQEQLAAIEELIQTSEHITTITQQVSVNMMGQTANSEEIVASSQLLNQMTQDVTTMSQQIADIANVLDQEAKSMMTLVDSFKLD